MKELTKALILVLAVLAYLLVYWKTINLKNLHSSLNSFTQTDQDKTSNSTGEEYPLLEPGIFFVETSARMMLPSLVSCSIESAARIYPDRPVYFFMKGLSDKISILQMSNYRSISLLASMKNVYILPLRLGDLFQNTPLYSWYQKVNPTWQRYWTHHVSDACRQVLLWKYGGIYMDTDVISIRPIPVEDFLAAESETSSSSAVLGFHQHHPFLWECMADYVKNYNGYKWAQQGPALYTRMLKKLCKLPTFENGADAMCTNISYLHPKRFFPIPWEHWHRYYQVWDEGSDIFHNSYALHFWNYMNTERRVVTMGSNTVAEHLFKKYCPVTYELFVKI